MPDEPEERELGYRLRTNAWGKGYATEGSRALIRHGFTQLGLTRVVANTMTVNTASRRVMEKCGLTYLRTYYMPWPETIEGTELGDVEYALTRDWLGGSVDRHVDVVGVVVGRGVAAVGAGRSCTGASPRRPARSGRYQTTYMTPSAMAFLTKNAASLSP